MNLIALPVDIVLQGTIEPSGVLNLLYKIFSFTLYLNWRRASESPTWDLIRLVLFKEADMEDWVDLVVLGKFQMIGAVINFL